MVGAMYPGGMENFIINLYEKIDKEKFQFDFIVHARKENDYKDYIEEMGGRVYVLPRLTKNPIKSLSELYKILKKNKYKIVIRHTANALVVPQLIVAKLAGAKTICHAHNETDPQVKIHKLGRIFMKAATDKRLACSVKAGKWMFNKADFQIVHNGINISKFEFDLRKAKKIREEFGAEEKHIYGHIANFIESKNHMFLLEIFKEIAEADEKAIFFCLGEGDLREQIEKKIQDLNLQEKVILTGIRHDADAFMSAMDVLIFPSFFEGLPLTLIEAQIAGLPAIISDRITEDVIITEGLVWRKSLKEDSKKWACLAIKVKESREIQQRKCQKELIQKAGYDMEKLAKWYEDFFDDLMIRKK